MKQCFLVLGYGIPKDIRDDKNYGCYLGLVFNAVFDWCTTHHRWNPVIIFSGGKTDMFKPYHRTEAREMIRLFTSLTHRSAVKERVQKWSLIPETRALSTLDNLLYTADLCSSRKLDQRNVIVFCEQTRQRRISSLAKKVFGKAKVIPLDFDQSSNRYLEPTFIRQKESEALMLDL